MLPRAIPLLLAACALLACSGETEETATATIPPASQRQNAPVPAESPVPEPAPGDGHRGRAASPEHPSTPPAQGGSSPAEQQAGRPALPRGKTPLAPTAGSSPPEVSRPVAAIGRELAARYRGRVPSRWGERLPGIVLAVPGGGHAPNGGAPHRTLSLTLDACGGKTDRRIIALLREHQVPATIFATNIWLNRNSDLARELAADPLFELACHGKRHKPASVNGRSVYGVAGTADIPALTEEVEDNARAVAAAAGTRPRWFRSGTAHYDDVALDVIHALGLAVAGYTVSADQGASLPAHAVRERMLAAPDGAIILCHMSRPQSGTFAGLAAAIPVLLEKGAVFIPLPEPPAP